ncbi:uncharacterized protein V1518DRAFT_422341 [Limtongia smithiae]|uniref:uncharacterized protein n=1 Tax=Limtongia smithiae TaxID=1125753 RepID=UPI0034CDD2AD
MEGRYNAAFLLQEILVESANIATACPSGIYVCPSLSTPRIWQGVIFLKKGPYAGGVFRFLIFFPDQYPYALPAIRMISTLTSHPLVNPLNNEFDLTQGEGGERGRGDMATLADVSQEPRLFYLNGRVHIGRILSYFKRSFKSSSLDQLSSLYQHDRTRFEQIATQDAALSRATHILYEEDENGDPYAGNSDGADLFSILSGENVIKFAHVGTEGSDAVEQLWNYLSNERTRN